MSMHEWSGAYVLGALEPEERRRFEDHLATCDQCRTDVAAFAPIPGLLSRVEPSPPVEVPAIIAAEAIGRARAEWQGLVASQRRWRWTAIAAVLVATALVTGLVWPRPVPPATALTLEPDSIATGTVTVESRAWGSAIFLHLENLPPSDRYVAWAVDASGQWQQVAVWGPTGTSAAIVDASSSITPDRLDAVVITKGSYRDRVATARFSSG